MPPLMQGVFERSGHVIGCGHVSVRPLISGFPRAAGRYGDARIRSSSNMRARSPLQFTGSPDPDLVDHLPLLFADLLTFPTSRP